MNNTEKPKNKGGRPKKNVNDLRVRYGPITLSQAVANRLDRLPKGKRAQFVETAIQHMFDIQDGKANFTVSPPENNEEDIL